MRRFFILSAGLLMACSAPPPSNSEAPKPHHLETSLAGSEWNLGDGSQVFIAFKSDGKFIGHGGCNSLRGRYEQTDKTIKIGPLATTRKMCPPEVMAIERKLLDTLKDAKFLEATHLTLVLNDSDGQLLMNFKRSDWD